MGSADRRRQLTDREDERLDYAEFLRRLPKAELHIHLESTMRASTALELARRYDVSLGSDDPVHLYDWLAEPPMSGPQGFFYNAAELVEFLRKMSPWHHIVYTSDEFARIVYETLEDEQRNGNLRYREMFFSPMDHLVDGVAYATIVDGLVEGVHAAQQDLGVTCRLVAGINRAYGPRAARELVEQMTADPRDEVIGIGLDALTSDTREAPERYIETYALAGKAGLHRTAHVAENSSETAGNIAIALDELGCERIDHGYQIVRDPGMIERCLAEEVSFCCSTTATLPSLTRRYGWGDLATGPIRTMIDAGLRVSLSCDSSCFPGSDLGTEYSRGIIGLAKGPEVAREIVLNGIDAAWLPPYERGVLRQQFESEIDELEARLDSSTVPASV